MGNGSSKIKIPELKINPNRKKISYDSTEHWSPSSSSSEGESKGKARPKSRRATSNPDKSRSTRSCRAYKNTRKTIVVTNSEGEPIGIYVPTRTSINENEMDIQGAGHAELAFKHTDITPIRKGASASSSTQEKGTTKNPVRNKKNTKSGKAKITPEIRNKKSRSSPSAASGKVKIVNNRESIVIKAKKTTGRRSVPVRGDSSSVISSGRKKKSKKGKKTKPKDEQLDQDELSAMNEKEKNKRGSPAVSLKRPVELTTVNYARSTEEKEREILAMREKEKNKPKPEPTSVKYPTEVTHVNYANSFGKEK